ncbi:MAG TPA: pyridoxamine 5'-phosphate oxidase family protein [Desulfosarcina sp.]|nr:pyridoxamine 5'-phosphate oxidase family protein [Desulfosarcina sp.]
MDRPMRRKDRRLDDAATMDLLRRGEYGILSTTGADGRPYGIPVNYVVQENALYFHCANEGQKIENITANRSVSFCVVGRTEVLPDKFSTRYESVVVSGAADLVVEAGLRRRALQALIAKYAPDHAEAGEAYIDRLMDQTSVVRVSIDHVAGKARK